MEKARVRKTEKKHTIITYRNTRVALMTPPAALFNII